MIEAGPLTFLTPAAGLVALLGLVPLAALYVVSENARSVREFLGLAEPSDRRLAAAAAGAVVAVALLVGLAAAQPVLAQTNGQRVRSDAEVMVVMDISRSMLASASPGAPSRIDRAKADALRLRDALPDVPVGLSSMTDRVLPHLLPSADENVFRATLEQAIGIEQPPPISYFSARGTTLAALAAVQSRGFFTPGSRRRVLVVFTDGETRPLDASSLGTVLRRAPGIRPVFVHVWSPSERVFTDGVAEPGYRSDPRSGSELSRIASAAGGSSFGENELGAVSRIVRSYLGTGPTAISNRSRDELALAPYLVLLAALPLSVLLLRLSR